MKTNRFIILALFMLASLSGFGQNKIEKDFDKKETEKKKYFESEEMHEADFEGEEFQKGVTKWMNDLNGYDSSGSINYAARLFKEHQKLKVRYPDLTNNTNANNRQIDMNWHSIGPKSYETINGWTGGIGRVICIAFHPFDPSTIYIGTAFGGIWRTFNNGSTWECITDNIYVLGISSIVVDYTNPSIIYALSGGSSNNQSLGVIKSTDGGNTWYATGLVFNETDYISGFKLLIHPTNPSILFAATSNGIYKTTTAGTAWTLSKPGVHIYDMEFKPFAPQYVYAVSDSQFIYSTNTGVTWKTDTAHFHPKSKRMSIAVTQAKSTEIVILSGGDSALSKGFDCAAVYVSIGNTYKFKLKSSLVNIIGYNSTDPAFLYKHQASSNLVLNIDRFNFQTIYAGGICNWKSIDTGRTWQAKTHWDENYTNTNSGGVYIHADQQALEINPLNNYLYAANDGGVFYSIDGGTTWDDLTAGLRITQIFGISKGPNNGYFMGTYDNGCNYLDTSLQKMTHILGGDYVATEYHLGQLYALYAFGDGLSKYISDPITSNPDYSEIQPANKIGDFNTSFQVNPLNDSVFIAYDSIYVAFDPTSPSSWSFLPNSENLNNTYYNDMDITPANTNLLFASDAENLYRFDIAGGSSTLPYYSAPSHSINTFCVSDDNISKGDCIWIGFRGYNNERVVFTKDGGINWFNYSNGLPQIPIYNIENIPGDQLLGTFASTALGIYYRDTTMSQWELYNKGLPNVPITDFIIDPVTNTIVAGTFGRGVWISPINLCLVAPDKPTIKSDGGDVICSAESFKLHAVSPCASSYLWSNGATTDNITISTAGTYTLTVSNSYGISPPAEIRIYNANEIAVGETKHYGGPGYDLAYKVSASQDNNFYLAGVTYAGGGDVTGYHPGNNPNSPTTDGWIVKVDDKFNILWQRAFGGSKDDGFYGITSTPDSGCIAIGYTWSVDGDLQGRYNGTSYADVYIVKLKKTGQVQWQKFLGFGDHEYGFAIDTTRGGYFVIAKAGSYFSWKIKLDFNGNYIWDKGYAPADYGAAPYSIKSTNDKGFVSLEINAACYASTNSSANIIKYDSLGTREWCSAVNIGFTGGTFFYDIVQTKDNGFAAASSNYLINSASCDDSMYNAITRVNAQGVFQWSRCIGSHHSQFPISDLVPTNDNGIIAIMMLVTSSDPAFICQGTNGYANYLVQLDSLGNIVWEQCLPHDDYFYGLTKTKYGGVVAAGGGNTSQDFSLIDVTRQCPQPFSGFTTTNIGTVKATVRWTKRSCAQSHVVQYRAVGASKWTEKAVTTPNGYIINGLVKNTKYEWRVQSKCSALSYSEFSDIQYFTTTASRYGQFDEEEEIAAKYFSVFPNPAEHEITVSGNQLLAGSIKLELFNNVGVLVKTFNDVVEQDIYSRTVSLHDIKGGVYFLKITTGNGAENFKVIKL